MTNNKARFIHRLLAWFTETCLVILITAAFVNFIAGQPTIALAVPVILTYFILIFFNPLIIYLSIPLTYYFGGSLGKLLTGLRITDEDGKKLSFKRILFRQTIGYSFSSLVFGLGYLAIIKGSRRQGWHDKTVGSLVIIKQNLWPLASVICILSLLGSGYFFALSYQKITAGPLIKEAQTLWQKMSPSKTSLPQQTVKPETITKWRTHNEMYYSIEYPNTWNTSSWTPGYYNNGSIKILGNETAILPPPPSDKGFYNNAIRIFVADDSQGWPLEYLIVQMGVAPSVKSSDLKTTYIDGYLGTEYTSTLNNVKRTIVIIRKNREMFVILLTDTKPYKISDDIFQRMIDSFKFTNEIVEPSILPISQQPIPSELPNSSGRSGSSGDYKSSGSAT